MSLVDWDSAPEGATHYSPPKTDGIFSSCAAFWREDNGRLVEFWGENTPGEITHVKNANGFAMRADQCIARPQPWNGEGLPPVGAACEAWIDDGRVCWHKVSIIGVHYDHADLLAVAILDNSDKLVWANQFRPIRTKAQIEADEREAALDDMHGIYLRGASDHCGGIAAIYDAGYRKQPTKQDGK